jgi:hypothetical protein
MLTLEIIMIDLRGILNDFRPHQFGPFFFWSMWLVIVFSSLRGVDRRDELAQLTYMAATAAFGVVFLFMLPIGRPPQYTAHDQIVLFFILLIVPSLRWMVRRHITELELKIANAMNEGKVKEKK